MEKWSFGIDNDKLIELVLSGKKTATSSLYDKASLPVISEESIIIFDNEKEACVVRTKGYKIIRFGDVTEDMAFLEGEGDLSLRYWKKVHYEFFKSQDDKFNEDSKIIFEEFEVIKNLVQERLHLGEYIASKNLDLFESVITIKEINAGFNNTLFNVNDKYVIKVCTNKNKEDEFKVEYNFYKANLNNKFIPKLYKFDDSKKDIEYVYEILEKLDGNTLYYYWYKMEETERENTIKKLMDIIKEFHISTVDENDWKGKITSDIEKNIIRCKELFNCDDYNMILESIKKYDLYLNDNYFSLLHNDLHFDNIIYNNGDLKIIDFNDSIVAPIDFEFRQLYMCQEQPWKWANIEMDPLQKAEDYKYIWKYIKDNYEKLSSIKYLEERMIIYSIWNDSGHLIRFKTKELIDRIIDNSKKLL